MRSARCQPQGDDEVEDDEARVTLEAPQKGLGGNVEAKEGFGEAKTYKVQTLRTRKSAYKLKLY